MIIIIIIILLCIQITNIALDIVREDLQKANDKQGLAVIEELIHKMDTDDEERTLLEQIMNDADGPRSFMEQLYYKGITEGLSSAGLQKGKSVNIIRIAENLFTTRAALANEAIKFLTKQSLENRQYYKMIKVCKPFKVLYIQ